MVRWRRADTATIVRRIRRKINLLGSLSFDGRKQAVTGVDQEFIPPTSMRMQLYQWFDAH